ncbi:MAG: glycosyltransferase family 4 protein [Phycisphaerae bacterium]|nr:glycosyltransferase family 4 protein [Phycisphaerae bacterium]
MPDPAKQTPPNAIRRVVLVLDSMHPGGKERVVMHLAKRFAQMGVVVKVIIMRSCGEFGDKLISDGIDVDVLNSNRRFDVAGILRLRKILKAFAPDVINVHDRSSLPYVTAARGRRDYPIVFTAHGLLHGAKCRWKDRAAMRKPAAVTAVSSEVARRYSELLRMQRDVEIVRNGVGSFTPTGKRGEIRKRLGLGDSDTFVFLAVGNLKPEKGYPDLLEAVRLLCDQNLDQKIRIVIVGGGSESYRLELETLRDKLKLGNMVQFAGSCGNVSDWYTAADAFVLPSRTEGLPMVLLEAMNAGLPAIASDVGAVGEVIEPGQSGILTRSGAPGSLAAAMSKLASSPQICELFRTNAPKRIAQHYSDLQMAEGYLRVFQQVRISQGFSLNTDNNLPGVMMLGPYPVSMTAGGMSSVMRELVCSDLVEKYRVTIVNTGKTTRAGRWIGAGLMAQWSLLRKIVCTMRKTRTKILHIHTCSGFTFWRDALFAAVGRMFGRRIVWHIHGGKFESFASSLGCVRRMLMRRMLRKSCGVIVLSDEWKRRFDAIFPTVEFIVIPNGVRIPNLSDSQINDSEKMRVLFLGNLSQGKGAEDLILAVAGAARKGFDGTVEIAGGQTMFGQVEALEELITREKCGDVVKLVGTISGDAKDQSLSAADCIALPSYSEALPMALLEGMARGLAVIATNVGAIPEIVTDGVEGFLIQPGDIEKLSEILIKLNGDPQLRSRMGAAARKRVEAKFNLAAVTGQIDLLYRKILMGGEK